MTRRSHLPRQDAVFADMSRAREPDLSAENRVLADLAGMPYEHEIINFCAAANARFSDSGSIDARVGLNLHIVLNHDRGMLLDLVPTAVRALRKSEAIAPDDHSVLQNHSISNPAIFPHHGLRMRQEIVSNLDVPVKRDEAMKHRVAAHFDSFIDEAVRPDVRAFADSGRFGHDGSGMNSGDVLLWSVEEFDCPREIKIRIF